MRLLALHGFLGVPDDFAPLTKAFAEKGHELVCPSLFDFFSGGSPFDFSNWVSRAKAVLKGETFDVLLGYSLGGRLAIELLFESDLHFQKAILLSTHFGLSGTSEKETRLKQDEQWALRFEREDFEHVLNDWNAQSVFAGDTAKRALSAQGLPWAEVLRGFSLAKQAARGHRLHELKVPTLWMVGEKDLKFTELINGVELPPWHRVQRVKGAGHRIPLTHFQEIAEKGSLFLAGSLNG